LERIDRDQVEDYHKRKGMSVAEVERWLGPNLNYEPAQNLANPIHSSAVIFARAKKVATTSKGASCWSDPEGRGSQSGTGSLRAIVGAGLRVGMVRH